MDLSFGLFLSGTTITLTSALAWTVFKWLGLIILLGSIVGFFAGDLPDNPGSDLGNFCRYLFWPLLLLWVVVVLFKGLGS